MHVLLRDKKKRLTLMLVLAPCGSQKLIVGVQMLIEFSTILFCTGWLKT